MSTKTIGSLAPGDTFRHAATEADVTVVSVEPTGSVKFAQSGPEAVPMLRVTVTGMPKPFAGRIEVAADKTVEVL